jgi:hypothetical protein
MKERKQAEQWWGGRAVEGIHGQLAVSGLKGWTKGKNCPIAYIIK